MRVRESAPSFDDVSNHYPIAHDTLDLVASFEGKPKIWVLTEYLSKVATWRRLRKLIGDALPRDDDALWVTAYHGLEGAPEWLREAYIEHVMDNDIPYEDALRVSYRPRRLP
jgi:hypothetical protein